MNPRKSYTVGRYSREAQYAALLILDIRRTVVDKLLSPNNSSVLAAMLSALSLAEVRVSKMLPMRNWERSRLSNANCINAPFFNVYLTTI